LRSDYSFSVPKKIRQMALRTVLSARLGEGNVVFLESAKLPDAKTKTLMAGAEPWPEPLRKRQRPRADVASSGSRAALEARGWAYEATLLVDDLVDENLYFGLPRPWLYSCRWLCLSGCLYLCRSVSEGKA
jgi:hypothetical protein